MPNLSSGKFFGSKFQVSLRKNAISQAVNKMGKYILLYRGKFSWIDCLSLYRGKDVIEKGFDVLKNDIDIMPANLRGVLTELEKIKIMILPNGERITTEVTKKQREILDALHTCA